MKVELKCFHCHKKIKKFKSEVNRTQHQYCSYKCANKHQPSQSKHLDVVCLMCAQSFRKKRNSVLRSPNHFCSRSCSVRYHNLHKTKGSRRSKLETYIEQQLKLRYETLDIHFNRKDSVGAELDIFIPSLKLAFEINGVFHYKPIFGNDKFKQIQENDIRKSKLCHERQVVLHSINTSHMFHFKEQDAKKYLDAIISTIDGYLTISPDKSVTTRNYVEVG